jgi:hypothetical protein
VAAALLKKYVGADSDRDFGLLLHNVLMCKAKSASETPPTGDSFGKGAWQSPSVAAGQHVVHAMLQKCTVQTTWPDRETGETA